MFCLIIKPSGHGGLSMAAPAPSASSSSPDPKDSMLIVSGGEGYIDFRIGKLFFAVLLLLIKPN
jgi:hypothetical protein